MAGHTRTRRKCCANPVPRPRTPILYSNRGSRASARADVQEPSRKRSDRRQIRTPVPSEDPDGRILVNLGPCASCAFRDHAPHCLLSRGLRPLDTGFPCRTCPVVTFGLASCLASSRRRRLLVLQLSSGRQQHITRPIVGLIYDLPRSSPRSGITNGPRNAHSGLISGLFPSGSHSQARLGTISSSA